MLLKFSHREREKALVGPCIVISCRNARCNAVYYLQAMAFDERNGIALVSYQGEAHLVKLLDTGKVITRGKELQVRAKVKQFQFSGHSDRDELFDMMGRIKGNPKVLTVHGDSQSCQMFAQQISEKFGFDAHAESLAKLSAFKLDLQGVTIKQWSSVFVGQIR